MASDPPAVSTWFMQHASSLSPAELLDSPPAKARGEVSQPPTRDASDDDHESAWSIALGSLPFIVVHLLPLGALWTGVKPIDVAVCCFLYFIRMFGVTGVYHRYFSHRTYQTSRWFQFVLALVAMSSSQRGALWWASHHRHHHKTSDAPEDLHSPRQRGLFYAHLGWMFLARNARTNFDGIKDFSRYPELVFLDKYWVIPQSILGFGVWLWLGWSGLWIGFMLSTALLWHGTFTINSLTHVFGRKVYETGDDSRNSFILALVTLGEGWHNNHHYYQFCARQGFHWWQIDITYYMLRGLAAVGLIWDVREPSAEVIDGGDKRVDRLARAA